MLEEHPFFAHPHPPPYDDSFESSSGEPSKCGKKAHKERAKKRMEDDEQPEKPEFGFGHSCGRGRAGRGFFRHHLGHEQEHGFSQCATHEGPGLGHHHRHSHHGRGGLGPQLHTWGMCSGLGRGPGGRGGRGFGHHFYNFHHMHPRFRSFHHSHDAASFTPPVDIFVTATQTIVHVSLPGAQKSDLSIAYDATHSILRMAGVVHRPEVDEEMYRALLVEERARHVGVFEREVPISHTVAIEGVQARLVDGVLRVALPRVEGEVGQPDEEMEEMEKEGANSELSIEGEEEEEHEDVEEEVEREYVKVDIQ
ncbi:hypothetical protein Aspvir_004467 [Aspergillus viridinutans]|uniref:SHSP domain-containing protein n=1 Tax=Aspergillus viridinutans TaxID=75553 RepID=A0A9P3BR22_ASPVI|nr:uncharacterized protein Aspvir_004467 [Aspergillus viridinutans]GIK00442.1 hypothetical protein Aspvir_004467 [Aspergillus viridinutans]